MLSKRKRNTKNKVRFEQTLFRRQLQTRRNYRRVTHSSSLSIRRSEAVHFFQILFSVACAAFLVYLFFLPNFFTLKSVAVVGGTTAEQTQLVSTMQSFLQTKYKSIFPLSNPLFATSPRVSDFILANNSSVLRVTSVHKNIFKRELSVQVEFRQPLFLLSAGDRTYTVAQDGVVFGEMSSGSPIPKNLQKILTSSDVQPIVGQKYLQENVLHTTKALKDTFFSTTGLGTDFVEFTSRADYFTNKHFTNGATSELALHTYASRERKIPAFIVFYDTNSDVDRAIVNTKLLLDSLNPDKLHALAYIDMRFKNKGFVCTVGAPCIDQPSQIESADTSTHATTDSLKK